MYLNYVLYSGGNADDDNDDDVGGEAIVAAAEPREEARAPVEAGAEEEERGANRPENSVGEYEIREEPESWVLSSRGGGAACLKENHIIY